MDNITIKWLIFIIFFVLFCSKLCFYYVYNKKARNQTNVIYYFDYYITLILLIIGICFGYIYNKKCDFFDIVTIPTFLMVFIITSKQFLPYYFQCNVNKRRIKFINRMRLIILLVIVFLVFIMIS